MAAAVHLYANFIKLAASKAIDLINDDIRVMLTTSSYTPNINTDVYKDVSVTNEVSGTGYTANGIALTGKTFNAIAGGKVVYTAAAASWAGSTITASYGVIYDNTPSSSKPLIGWVDLGGVTSDTNGSFTINWDATNGIWAITVS